MDKCGYIPMRFSLKNRWFPIQHSFGSVGHSNQGRKRSKRNPDRKRRSETLAVCR